MDTDVHELPIEAIVLNPELNLRDCLDEETVHRYAEAPELLPPVTVYQVDGDWLLADGFHRHAAFVARGQPMIPAIVVEGQFEDALNYAAGANLNHGLPLNRAERRRVVAVKLQLHPEHSDRQIAKELGVSRDLVARVRAELANSGQIPELENRIGADGKVYPSTGSTQVPNASPIDDRPDESDEFEDDDPDRQAETLDDDRDREPGGKRPRKSPSDNPGGSSSSSPKSKGQDEGPAPTKPGGHVRDLAQAEPAPAASPTIDEMLELMTRQVMEVVSWIENEDFEAAYDSAGSQPRYLFQAAVRTLADRAGQLD